LCACLVLPSVWEMRKEFGQYLVPSEAFFENLWETGVLVLDANILHGVYRASEDTRNKLLSVFEKFQGRVWVPHQAGLEFMRSRIKTISDQADCYLQSASEIGKLVDTLGTSRHPFLEEKHINSLKEVKAELQKRHEAIRELLTSDPIFDRLATLLEGRVGEESAPAELDGWYKSGKTRYEAKIPPGFKDEKKPEPERYGDLVLWLQLLKKAKAEKWSVIFVTDDTKEDWFLHEGGGKKVIHPALRKEFADEVKSDFYAYTSPRFLEFAGTFFKTDTKAAVEELRESQAVPPTSLTDTDSLKRYFVSHNLLLAKFAEKLTQFDPKKTTYDSLLREISKCRSELLDLKVSLAVNNTSSFEDREGVIVRISELQKRMESLTALRAQLQAEMSQGDDAG
jgi:hypothetical protein